MTRVRGQSKHKPRSFRESSERPAGSPRATMLQCFVMYAPFSRGPANRQLTFASPATSFSCLCLTRSLPGCIAALTTPLLNRRSGWTVTSSAVPRERRGGMRSWFGKHGERFRPTGDSSTKVSIYSSTFRTSLTRSIPPTPPSNPSHSTSLSPPLVHFPPVLNPCTSPLPPLLRFPPNPTESPEQSL